MLIVNGAPSSGRDGYEKDTFEPYTIGYDYTSAPVEDDELNMDFWERYKFSVKLSGAIYNTKFPLLLTNYILVVV